MPLSIKDMLTTMQGKICYRFPWARLCRYTTFEEYIGVRRKNMKSTLEKFLLKADNTHVREAILMHRLFLDVKLAAARHGYYLNTYFDDVDRDGFDVIFDDHDYIKKTQVKSVCHSSKTLSWLIHKKIMRPSFENIEKLGFECSPTGEGTEGGVILIEFKDSSPLLDIDYYYTDLFVLLAYEYGVLTKTHQLSKEAIEKCTRAIQNGSGGETVSIPKTAFLKAKNADALLSLMGLHSASSFAWKHHVMSIANHESPAAVKSIHLPTSVGKLKEIARQELADLCV